MMLLRAELRKELHTAEERMRALQRGKRDDAFGYAIDAAIGLATIDTLRAVIRAFDATLTKGET